MKFVMQFYLIIFIIFRNISNKKRSANTVTFDWDVRSSNCIARFKRQSKEIFAMEQYTARECSQIVEIHIKQLLKLNVHGLK